MRFEALRSSIDLLESFHSELRDLPVSTPVEAGEIRRTLEGRFDFDEPLGLDRIVDDVCSLLRRWNVHTTHPRHFGLFVPGIIEAGVAADAIAAAFNPQLGAWWYSPAASEIERHVLRRVTRLMGLPAETFACFTSGTSEANMTALATALTKAFPRYAEEGAGAVDGRPRIYASHLAHDSIDKIAHLCGIGRGALRRIEVDGRGAMRLDDLRRAVALDRANGDRPLCVIATFGTTAVGTIDPLLECASFCREEDLWLHVDAAWGGGVMFSDRLRPLLRGIERADSVTWDPHKTLPVPMGAGILFCRHTQAVRNTFQVTASYVPPEVGGNFDLYRTGVLWSRRFIGLKVFMALAALGREGLSRMIDGQCGVADRLRARLRAGGWRIVNDSPLPVVCFRPPHASNDQVEAIVRRVVDEGRFWLSFAIDGSGAGCCRVCITHHGTDAEDLEALVAELEEVACAVVGEA